MSGRFVVVGAGTMGLGIAYVAAGAGHAVELSPVGIGRPHLSAAQVRVFGG